MQEMPQRGAWVQIDLRALQENFARIQSRIGAQQEPPKIMAVVKADAYGHGAVLIARTLAAAGAEELAVATLAEGMELREAGIALPITLLGDCPGQHLATALSAGVLPMIAAEDMAKDLSQSAPAGVDLRPFVAIDTGMGRYGLVSGQEDLAECIATMDRLPGLQIRGLFTHFASADEADKGYVREQMERLLTVKEQSQERGIHDLELCAANSGAILDSPETWQDMVRPGIILYGIYPSEEVKRENLALEPVMSVKARIVQIRTLQPGETAGYGREFTAARESRIATLPLGYADGLPRMAARGGRGLLYGQAAPIAGRICMDQCMIDVTDIPQAKEGDVVTILGRSGKLEITAEEIAELSQTIPYETTCRFGQRLEKIYIDKGEGK